MYIKLQVHLESHDVSRAQTLDAVVFDRRFFQSLCDPIHPILDRRDGRLSNIVPRTILPDRPLTAAEKQRRYREKKAAEADQEAERLRKQRYRENGLAVTFVPSLRGWPSQTDWIE